MKSKQYQYKVNVISNRDNFFRRAVNLSIMRKSTEFVRKVKC